MLSRVSVSTTRRPPSNIEQLAASIREVGLLNPITITEQYRLVAGSNRLAACKLLGWKDIPACILPLNALDAELAEIDENLIRNELTVLERAEQVERRKRLYEAKYPQAAKPKGGRRPRNGEIISPFSEDTAKATGVSPRTIQQEVQIACSLRPEAKALIRDTPFADQTRSSARRRLSPLVPPLDRRLRQAPHPRRQHVGPDLRRMGRSFWLVAPRGGLASAQLDQVV